MGHDHARGGELAKLVDEEQLDAVLAAVTLEEVAEAWHCYHRRHPNNDDDPDWWAVEFWLTIGYEHEDVLRAGLLALVDTADEEHLGLVGAGPLEAFVCEEESRIRWLEMTAAKSAGLRAALRNVYCWGLLDDRVCERLERAAQGQLPRPQLP